MHTYLSMRPCYPAVLFLSFFLTHSAVAQISGRVVFNPGREMLEKPGLSGVVVRGYGVVSGKEDLIAESVTDDQGHYLLDIPSGKRARVVFSYEDPELVSLAQTPRSGTFKARATTWTGLSGKAYRQQSSPTR